MVANDVMIIKGNGEREPFDISKLLTSLQRAGATVFVAEDVAHAIAKEIRSGMTTTDIYNRAHDLLGVKSQRTAAHYSLRRSIQNLGPTGFPFEEYIAQLLTAKGYTTKTGQVMQGKCVEHEVDVVAWNDTQCVLVEAKFHNQHGYKADTKTALYVKARFDDMYEVEYDLGGKKRKMTRGLLITNTKFTENSKKYGRCVDTFDMISWEYPEKGNLYDIVAETGLHPMTCLPMSNYEKEELLKRGVVNCKTIKENPEFLKDVGMKQDKIDEIMDNIDMLCSVEK